MSLVDGRLWEPSIMGSMTHYSIAFCFWQVCASPNCECSHGSHSVHGHAVRTHATRTNQARQKPARSITPSQATEQLLHQYSTLHSDANGKFVPNPADSCPVNLVR